MRQSGEKSIIQALYPSGKMESDDCYLWGKNNLITTDSLVEKVHFTDKWSSPQNIASKLLEVNISDIVASGGLPTHVFLNLGLPRNKTDSWLKEFVAQFKKTMNHYNLILAGGDTFLSPKLFFTITMIGQTESPILRKNIHIGDSVYITGPVGYSLLGYKTLKKINYNRYKAKWQDLNEVKRNKTLHRAISHHLAPKSKLDVMTEIYKKRKINAAIDVSDGIIQDLDNLTQASGKGFKIHIDQLPDFSVLHTFLHIDEILTSGEELQILFTSPDEDLENLFPQVKKIGEAMKQKKTEFIFSGKKHLQEKKGFYHF